MKLTRRRFAALVAATAASGCLDNGDENGEDDGRDDVGDENSEDGDGDGTPTTEFRGRAVPPLPHADETLWYHDRGEVSVYLEPSDETVEPPAEVEFTLRNEGDEAFGVNPYDWDLYKLHDGDWKRLKARETPEPWQMVEPGEAVSQTVALGGEDPDYAVGDGVYGFYLGRRDRGAAFEVTGAELALEPVEGVVTRVERDEETGVVTVYTTYYDEIEEYQTPGTLVVRREGAATREAPTVIREQGGERGGSAQHAPVLRGRRRQVRLRIPTSRRGSLGHLTRERLERGRRTRLLRIRRRRVRRRTRRGLKEATDGFLVLVGTAARRASSSVSPSALTKYARPRSSP